MANWLSTEEQESFWAGLDPDVRLFLTEWEGEESWTYSQKDCPELFSGISEAMPSLAALHASPSHTAIVRELISVLVALPLKQCIYALSWLDRQHPETRYGWGVLCLVESARIANDDEDESQADAQAFSDRIRIMLQSTLATRIFSHAEPMRAAI